MSSKTVSVLHVIGNMNRGGAETFLMNVLRNIDRNKFEFIFLCYGDAKSDYEDEITQLGGRIVRTPDVKDVGILAHIQHLRRIIAEYNIDVVHAHTYYNSLFSLIAATLSGVLRIAHSHSTQSEPNPNLAKRVYFLVSKIGIELFANKFVACGNEAGRALYMPWRKFQVINNGINIKDFVYDQDNRNSIRTELGINKNATVLMHAGRFAEVKNHDFLIDTFAEYQKYDPKSQLILVGDGPLRKKMEDKVEKLNLSNAVKFLGLRSDVYRIYSAADAFVFPSIFEGLPVVLIEAQANGIKCIISDAVDKNVKVTDSVIFHSLSSGPKTWARHIFEANKAHVDNSHILANGAYDMSANIDAIQMMYSEARNAKK
ncbi:glycosyltransferase family 1 protein [Candidatus Saccharibacteria bacterium]|nr:glycosyltransferase family 1 protein [Candidatus Saccharibacteria bacterium]